MKISILIPTYNRSKLLSHVLSDMFNQKTKIDFEVIIIDDKSTDSTKKIVSNFKDFQYVLGKGKGQKEAKRQAIHISRGEFILFLEDDIRIKDIFFLEKLSHKLNKNKIIISKIIMLDKGEKNIISEPKQYSVSPNILIETSHGKNNEGNKIRNIFPFMETGVCFHKTLSHFFYDKNLIGDAYGESYSSGIQLLNEGYILEFHPDLLIEHIGSKIGGSKKYQKQNMLLGFTNFHYGYFFNMVYLHSRFQKKYIFIWLPFYVSKACIALLYNRDFKGFKQNAISAIFHSLKKHYKKIYSTK